MFIDWIPTVVKWLSLLSILFWLSVCFWTEVICQSSVACPLSLCLFLQIQSLNLDMAKLTIFSIPFIDILMFLWKTYWFYGAILFMTSWEGSYSQLFEKRNSEGWFTQENRTQPVGMAPYTITTPLSWGPRRHSETCLVGSSLSYTTFSVLLGW